MLQILCWIDSEDFYYLNSLNEKGQALDYYAYVFEVEGGAEGIGMSTVRLLVFEIISAKIAVAFVTPKNFKPEKDIRLRFTCHEKPSDDVPVEFKLSDEIKKANYMGDDLEKIEYIGYTLEKFYQGNDAKFYLHDLRPPEEQQLGQQGG